MNYTLVADKRNHWMAQPVGSLLFFQCQVGGGCPETNPIKKHHIVRRPLKEAFLASKIVILD